MDYFNNDLPDEHRVSKREPVYGGNGQRHFKQDKTPSKFTVLAPLAGRMYSFNTQSAPSTSRVLGMDTKRRGLAIQNLGNDDVYISVGTECQEINGVFAGGILVPSGAYFEFPAYCAPINDIYAVSSTSCQITIFESTLV